MKIPSPKQEEPLAVSQLYRYKTRFAMLGTVGSGKTSIAAQIVLTAQTLSRMIPEFRCRVLEGNSSILQATSNLRRGHFPPKTPPNTLYPPEAGLLLSWNNILGEKKIQVPICDVAGEEIQRLIKKTSILLPSDQAFYEINQVVKYVLDSDGFILAVPASRALIFDEDAKLELEPEDISEDPDVNLHSILESVLQDKELHGGKKIRGIAVVITKWDLLAPYAKRKGMDIYDKMGQGLENFMWTAFPGTMSTLKAYGLKNIRFFPSYLQVKRGSQGIERWDDGSPKIEMSERYMRIPKCDEQSYVDMFDYLKSFVT